MRICIQFVNMIDKADRLLIIESSECDAATGRREVERHDEAGHFCGGGRFRAMNLMPAKIGAEPKKVAVVVVLMAVAAYFYISNRNSGESDAPIAIGCQHGAGSGGESGGCAKGVAVRGAGRAGRGADGRRQPPGVPAFHEAAQRRGAIGDRSDFASECAGETAGQLSWNPPRARCLRFPPRLRRRSKKRSRGKDQGGGRFPA